MSPTGKTRRATPSGAAGFTLIELMIVIAILAISVRYVVPAFTRDIPERELQAEVQKLASTLGYLRSEARLQSKRYGLEFLAPDGAPHRYRIIMPREMQVIREGSELDTGQELPTEMPLDWVLLPDLVKFDGVRVGHLDEGAKQRQIFFDPRGRTSQKVLYLVHRAVEQGSDELVYSIEIPPLTGPIQTSRGRARFATAVDNDF